VNRASGTGGFTLIELLVVLVIVALISASLMYGFERVLDIRIRLAAFLDGIDTPTLVASWFRESINGLVPDLQNGPDQFAGGPRLLTGLTLAPLEGEPGVPTRISWTVSYAPGADRTYLRYEDATRGRLTIASWPGDHGGFQYCATNLTCGDNWPPPRVQEKELPALVLLNAVRGTEAWPILAAPRSGRDPLPRPANLASP
jgi:prepilin-type N-terminal cleavage/methylation domain-containing protein